MHEDVLPVTAGNLHVFPVHGLEDLPEDIRVQQEPLLASPIVHQSDGIHFSRCPGFDFFSIQTVNSIQQFKKTGRLGCAECYSHFEEGLTKMLKGMHKGLRHTGKVPRQPRPTRSLADRIQKLQRQLEAAVAVEDYEEAARLRDEIKALREQAPAA